MDVKHHSGKRGEFYLEDDGRKIAELTYNLMSENQMIIDSTYVSPSHREHGLGHKLINAAATYAREKSIKIETTCSFVRRVFRESNQYDDLKLI